MGCRTGGFSLLPPPVHGGYCVGPLTTTGWACVGRKILRILELCFIKYKCPLTLQTEYAFSRCSDCAALWPDGQGLKFAPVVLMVNPGLLEESDYIAWLQSYFQVQSSTWLSILSKHLSIRLRVEWMFMLATNSYSKMGLFKWFGFVFSHVPVVWFPAGCWHASQLPGFLYKQHMS